MKNKPWLAHVPAEVRIPREISGSHKSLPVYSMPSMFDGHLMPSTTYAGPVARTQASLNVSGAGTQVCLLGIRCAWVGAKVLGTLTGNGTFLETPLGHYLPLHLQGKQVLFEVDTNKTRPSNSSHLCKQPSTWLLCDRESQFKGMRFRNSRDTNDKANDVGVVYWGSYVLGVQVDRRWVQVGDYFLPIYFKDKQIMWEVCMSEVAAPKCSKIQDTICLQVLCPKLKKEDSYVLLGSFLNAWKDMARLEPGG